MTPGGEAADDQSIADDALLWRRVVPGSDYVFFDQNLGRQRASSAAFNNSPDGSQMSMFLATEAGSIEAILTGHKNFGVVSIQAGELRRLGLTIQRDAEGGPGHVLVCGPKTSSIRSKIARAAQLVRLPVL